jgi:hypothetical protein
MDHYQKMPKIQTLEEFKNSYGKTVKLNGILVKSQLKNKKMVVEENAFFIKLTDDMLVLLPTKNATDVMISHLQELTGTEIFVVGQPNPPEFPIIYDGLKMPSFTAQGFVTAIDDEMLIAPQVTNLDTLNIYREYMKNEDSFFAYLVGNLTQEIHANETFPLSTMILLLDKTPIEVNINDNSDIDILGYKGEKIFVKGKVKTKSNRTVILETEIYNFEKYMDYYSVH